MSDARTTTRRRAKPAVESSIYDGGMLCGTIVPRAGAFIARLAGGKSLGKFAKENEAQRALTAASRAARTPKPGAKATNAFNWRPGERVDGTPRGDAPLNKRARSRAFSSENSGVSQ